MGRGFSRSISESSVRTSLFVFFSLLVFGTAFFVFADDNTDSKNIFQDSDQDGLSNDEEKLYGTNPSNRDTDGDGYSDGVEVESGYDPLKKAPGDKIVKSAPVEEPVTTASASKKTLTEQMSQELAATIKTSSDTSEPITLDQMNASVQKIMESSSQEIDFPEIDTKDIKIKPAPSKKLSDKKRKEQERQDVVEYLTAMSYILANNSPKSFHSENELKSVFNMLSTESLTAITLGNSSYIDQITKNGERMLKEVTAVEVPEPMLDLHIKALRMATYATQMKSQLSTDPSDPLGQISGLSKIQGLVGVASSFAEEIQQKMTEYGIDIIPIDL
jgi:hypothetical protein